MSNRTDDKRSVISAVGTELEYLQSLGATANNVNDAWMEVFLANGATSPNFNDAAAEFLTGLGYSGALPDMFAAYWAAGGGGGVGGDLLTDLIAWFAMEEASGNLINQVNGSYNLTYAGGGQQQTGVNGYGLNPTATAKSFDPYYQFGANNDSFSIAFWFKPAATLNNTGFIGCWGGSSGSRSFKIGSPHLGGNVVRFICANAGGTTYEIIGPVLVTGTQYHFCITYDEATFGMELFVDGVSQGTQSIVSSLHVDGGMQFEIGGYGGGSVPNAIFDEAAIWRRVITTDDIAAHRTGVTYTDL